MKGKSGALTGIGLALRSAAEAAVAPAIKTAAKLSVILRMRNPRFFTNLPPKP
jgi:hypothetical protein